MRVTGCTDDFRSGHAEAGIAMQLHVTRIESTPKAWPAGSGIKFMFGAEQRRIAAHTTVLPGILAVVVHT